MLLSIILPSYNVAQYIGRAVNGLLEHGVEDCEIIIVDDGSTDNLGEVCRQWREIERVKVIRTENHGVAEARNVGLRIARGEYVHFMDPDDWMEGNMYGELLKVCKECNADILRFGFESNSGWEKRDFRMGNNSKIEYVGDEIRNELLPNYVGYSIAELSRFGRSDFKKGKELSFIWCFLFRRKMLIDNGVEFVKGLQFMEDKLFLCHVFCYAQKVVRYKKVCYHYETRKNGLSSMRFSDIAKFSEQRVLAEKSRQLITEKYTAKWAINIKPLYQGTLILASVQMFFMFILRLKFCKLSCVKQYVYLPQVKESLFLAKNSDIPLVLKIAVKLLSCYFNI